MHLINHFAFLAARRQGATVAEGRAGLVVDSGLDCDTFNVVVSDDAGMDLSSTEARAIASAFDGRSFSWWVGPQAPPQVHARLREIGFSPGAPEPGMSLELAHRRTSRSVEGLFIGRVQSPEQLVSYARVLASNWTPLDARVIQFYADTCSAALDPGSPLILLIGALRGVVVATAEVATGSDAVAGLYNVATLPSYRRQGIGAAMISEGIGEARRVGMVRLELQASHDGQRVYEQAGFRTQGFWTEFQSAKAKVGA